MTKQRIFKILFRLYAIVLSLGIFYAILSVLLKVAFGWDIDLFIPMLLFFGCLISLTIVKKGIQAYIKH